MKKIFATIAVAFVAVSMSAQIYVGGSLSFNAMSSDKFSVLGDKSETVFAILPEIGYNLNDEWAIGTVIGYQQNKFTGISEYSSLSESAFTFNPYVRYTFLNNGKLSLFVDGCIDYTTASDTDWNELGVGLKPGLAYALTDNISVVSHLGFIGWQQFNPDGDDNNISSFGLDMSGANLSFGLYFNF